MELEKDFMILNNVTKFHEIQIKTIQISEQTWFQTVNFHKRRALSPEV